jgi:multidrug resistance efflux pump
MRRMILVPLLVVLILLAVVSGVGYYIYNSYMYYSTDDSQVTGSIVSISAPTSGALTSLNVKQNDTVTAGQTIATVTPAGATGAAGATPVSITSPINGTILATSAVQGQAVAPGLTLLQLTDLNSLTVTAYVDENALNNVKVGQDVDIHVDAYSDTSFTGKVKQIVQATAGSFSLLPVQDNASGNFTKVGQRVPVIISLDGNGGKDILPGMSTEVTIHIH